MKPMSQKLNVLLLLVLCLFFTWICFHDKIDSSEDDTATTIDKFEPILKNRNKILNESKLILTCFLPAAARLGNLMFSYSSLLGLARRLNASVYLDQQQQLTLSKLFRFNFSIPSNLISCDQNSKEEEHPSAYDENILLELQDFRKSSNIRHECTSYNVGPYLQSWKYFDEFKNEIKSRFIFQTWISRRVARIKRKISEMLCANEQSNCTMSEITWIGIHVRRGDMDLESSRRKGYIPANKKYVNKAIESMEEKFKSSKIIFLLASDDVSWCRIFVESKSPLVFLEDVRNLGDDDSGKEVREELMKITHLGQISAFAIMDFAVLSSSNHVIMTVGSFGWWTGYLSGGTVVYYKDYPRPSSVIASGFKADDHYLSHWIAMS